MKTWHIHIEGQVQGVGFRPFVFLLAKEYGIMGCVSNTNDGVHIEFNAEKTQAKEFYDLILKNAPSLSHITTHRFFQSKPNDYKEFRILHSENSGKSSLLLTPDFALCTECRRELSTHTDRRYVYPFITCVKCGPRYSIIRRLPYDRENTSMEAFQMCSDCESEYENPMDRRYYSQTNSCPDCSIRMTLYDKLQNKLSENQETILEKVVEYWRMGKIVALKGIGGYILTCDASNEAAVSALRKRKHRPSKPFALLFPDLESLKKVAQLTKKETEALCGPVSPIVLLNLKKSKESQIATEQIAPGLQQIGAMLPYTPLYDLLLKQFRKPIVATSGNISNSPILYRNKKAISGLSTIADYILVNNRKIVIPQDDSVLKFTTYKEQKIVFRRSRGLAPTYINPELCLPEKTILATGAMLKSTFSFLHQGNIYISQYLGDLEDFDTQETYQKTILHFLQLFNVQPDYLLCDKHPEYPSSRFTHKRSVETGAPLLRIQHHQAHFGAILGEHNLLDSENPVLGVIWDGTGLGDDGHIWGGEFFKYENYEFSRKYHFDYFDAILGDKMSKEPRISALSACWNVIGAEDFLKEKFSKTEWQVYTTLLEKENSLKTSSVGRIFDAVASLLGIMDKQSYEGEAAMRLEALAQDYFRENPLDFSASYFIAGDRYSRIPTKALMSNIILDLRKGKSHAFIAAKFHFSMVQLIKIIANNLKINKIAFSGGVFQNGLLVDLILHHLKKDFQLFFHKELSPNDENISFGQLVCYQIKELNQSFIHHKSDDHVLSDSR